ncbi:ATP-binding protein [uncultured Jatrophihabitans sp.]|uniref:ATP-binding protein n=1 Tax=uncultured Jatrophihabitans sp. TaxID=1610747 RepID=UPI0035CC3276
MSTPTRTRPSRRRADDGRGVAQLVADFGHTLPPLVPAPAPLKDVDPFGEMVGKHGRRGRAAGWAPVPAPLQVYRMTSEQVGGVWPLIAGDGLPSTGAQMGVDFLSGGAFHVDPIGWTLGGVAGVTNPNMMFFGAPGRGKSGTVKMFCLRMMAYAYRTLILGDVKDEYEPLCRALGVEPHVVGHGLPARINPLDFGPLGNDWTHLPRTEAQRRAAMVFSRWLLLIKGLVGSQHVSFGPTAETAVGLVIRDLTGYAAGTDQLREITIPQLWEALNNPTQQLVTDCRYSSRQHFLDQTRPVRDALGSLVKGHLAGLFDAATTVDVDWRAPIQSLSLSRLDPLGDEAVGVALTCLNSWGRAMTQVAEPGDMRVIIRDECWKQMRLGTDAVKSLDADLRLSRRDGAIQVVIAHKPSDMLTVGDAGSQAVAIAKDLMHLCATKVLLGQDDQIGDELSDLLGLTPMAERIVTDWATAAKGRALWLVGSHVAKVQTVRTSIDVVLTDTNDAITARAADANPGLPAEPVSVDKNAHDRDEQRRAD